MDKIFHRRSKERRMIKNSKKPENFEAVRAAAHAWFEHGSSSSSSSRVICEFEAATSSNINSSQSSRPASAYNYKNKPSRFKLEAVATNKKSTCTNSINMHHSVLLDEYEVKRIVQDLDDYDSVSTLEGRRIRREAAGKDNQWTSNDHKQQALVMKRGISVSGWWAKGTLMCSTYANDVVVATRSSRMPKSH